MSYELMADSGIAKFVQPKILFGRISPRHAEIVL